MTLYQFKAIDKSGNRRQGTLEALSETEAKETLRARELMVMKLEIKKNISSKLDLKGANLLTFTLQLSQLINAGLPLFESLNTLEEQNRQESYHRVLIGLADQIKRGKSLSEAMQQYPGSFNRLYRSMIAAAESAGALDLMLLRLHQLLEKEAKIKAQISTALIYPSVLGLFSIAIIIGLFGFVIPQIEELFVDRELNGLTAFVIHCSQFLRNYWPYLLGVLIGTTTLIYLQLKTPKGKHFLNKIKLSLPIIKELTIHACTARFARTVATLQEGGVPLIDTLRLAAPVMQNDILEEEIHQAEKKIMEGSRLSLQLRRSRYFPPLLSRMLSVGEETGSIGKMLEKVADMYETELEKSLTRILTLIQPAMLLIMGGVIFIVMLAIILPLTDISQFNL